MKCLMKCFEVRRYLFLLIMLFCLIAPSIHLTAEDKGEKEAEQALEDFQKVMEEGKETKSFEEAEKKYEEGTKARSRLLKLGKLATPVLVRAIKTKRFSEQFRGTCIDMLMLIQDKKSVKPLIEVYRDESELFGIRKEAIFSLGKIGGPEVLPVLLEGLEHKEAILRKGAISGIWGLVGREVVAFPVDAIVDRAKNDKNISIRAYATASLRMGGKQAVSSLLELMNDENERVRLQACQSLGLIGDRRAIEPLLARLNDREAYERMVTIEALGNIGDRRAVEPLIKILNERGPSNEPRTSAGYAAKALAEIGDERAIEPLKRAIEDMKMWEQEVKEQTGESMYPDKWFTNAYKKLTGREYKQ